MKNDLTRVVSVTIVKNWLLVMYERKGLQAGGERGSRGEREGWGGWERVEGVLTFPHQHQWILVDVQTTVLALIQLISYSTRPLGITSIPQLETDDRWWCTWESRNVWVASRINQSSHITVEPCTNKGIANAWPWRRKTWTWFTVFGSFHLFSHHYQNNTRF